MGLPWLTFRGPITRGDFHQPHGAVSRREATIKRFDSRGESILSSKKREVDVHFQTHTDTNAFASPSPILALPCVHPCHPLPVQATIHPSHQSQPGATRASATAEERMGQPGPCVHFFFSSHSPFNYKKLGQLNFSLSSSPPTPPGHLCAPVETSQTAQRSLPSSLINTTAPPTGQNSLTCTRFSLQALYSTPPPPSPPPSGPARKQQKKKNEVQEEVPSRQARPSPHPAPKSLATHRSSLAFNLGNPAPQPLTTFFFAAKHKKHLPRPITIRAPLRFLLFSKPSPRRLRLRLRPATPSQLHSR